MATWVDFYAMGYCVYIQQTNIPRAQFGGRHAATMLPGGGIGPELMAHVREVFNAIGVPVDFEIIDIHPNSEGNEDLDYAIMSIKRNGVAIKGGQTHSVIHGIRKLCQPVSNQTFYIQFYIDV